MTIRQREEVSGIHRTMIAADLRSGNTRPATSSTKGDAQQGVRDAMRVSVPPHTSRSAWIISLHGSRESETSMFP